MENQEHRQNREQLQRLDEATLQHRVERAGRTQVHGVIPNHFFAPASSECRDAFINGHFYASISLAQAVAEGISKFLAHLHPLGAKKDPSEQVRRLTKRGVISEDAQKAFQTIWGNDRNTFHHVNPDIPTAPAQLEERAEECVNALFTIEAEIFAFDIQDGRLVPKYAAYWPEADDEHLEVFLRLANN